MKNDHKDFPPASLRTLQILDLFMADPSSKTLKTISEQLDIPFTSLYRIVLCMQEYHYLIEDPSRPNHFRLGFKVAQLSDIAFSEKSLIRAALPFMKQVATQLNQACQLCILTSDGVCTIEQYLPRSAITYITELNETIPINVSASGKILTALLPPVEQKRFLKKASAKFARNTEKTITDPEVLRMHLAEAARRGYGTDEEEYALGVGCVSVPIYTSAQRPVAAIGTTGPIEFYRDRASFTRILDFLKEISSQIGGRLS